MVEPGSCLSGPLEVLPRFGALLSCMELESALRLDMALIDDEDVSASSSKSSSSELISITFDGVLDRFGIDAFFARIAGFLEGCS